jgi:hypothetical protein
MDWYGYEGAFLRMRRTIQTAHGVITLEYEGGGIYRAPIPWFPGWDYIVFHDRQQSEFKVVLKRGKRGDLIGFGKDLDEACKTILAHAEY